MPDRVVEIRGIDPLLFRDGKPFCEEEGALHAQSLPLPLPGTLAGFLRTRIGERRNWKWSSQEAEEARAIPVAGPLAVRCGSPVFSSPADAVVHAPTGDHEGGNRVMCLRPGAEDDVGCDLPHESLRPLMVTEPVKPLDGYNYWPWEAVREWLEYPAGDEFRPPERIPGMPTDERVHAAMDSATGTADEGKLFTVAYRSFEEYRWKAGEVEECWSLLARVTLDAEEDLTGPGNLGGERRLTAVAQAQQGAWPDCPASLAGALSRAGHVRLILATPALFEGGWRPGWLDEVSLEGSPPSAAGLRLKLVGAAVRRREPVSGWDYQTRAPKRVRWMVPAGAVYFFDTVAGDPAQLAAHNWLQPVSDDEQDRRDGYGLALWGAWGSGGQR